MFSITDASRLWVNSLHGGNVHQAVNSLMERRAYAANLPMAGGNAVIRPSPKP